MTYYLVKFSRNWADELNVHGFSVYSEVEWEEKKEQLDKLTEFNFGTNEGWEDLTEGDLLSDMTVEEITEEQATVLYRVFPELIEETKTVDYVDSEGYDRTMSFTTGGAFGIFPLGANDD